MKKKVGKMEMEEEDHGMVGWLYNLSVNATLKRKLRIACWLWDNFFKSIILKEHDNLSEYTNKRESGRMVYEYIPLQKF